MSKQVFVLRYVSNSAANLALFPSNLAFSRLTYVIMYYSYVLRTISTLIGY